MRFHRLLLTLVLGSVAAIGQTGPTYPPNFADATVEVYKAVGETRLSLFIFSPPGGATAEKRAAIVFFFGGGWRQGNPAQFAMQCRRLASLGMVAITADYRVSSRNQTNVTDSVRDAKAAIRYIRVNALRLRIDPERIAAGGGSAGGTSPFRRPCCRGLTKTRKSALGLTR
ncbi:MAG TPA: alpha/beta hydrolase [Bryobacteraceae bacterium]|nr:alpha/beta hydrolase [Bryobacteraceae bacterium]